VPCAGFVHSDSIAKEIAMHFRIRGLAAELFLPLAGLTDQELAARGVHRKVAERNSGMPDRVALRDAEPGERVLLLNFQHQAAATPYRSSHAIYVIEGERQTFDSEDVPESMRSRMLSLRAFDDTGMIVGAELVDGREVEGAIETLFELPAAAYLHAHYAKYGCYAARVDRAA
jgi:hypothetical protein